MCLNLVGEILNWLNGVPLVVEEAELITAVSGWFEVGGLCCSIQINPELIDCCLLLDGLLSDKAVWVVDEVESGTFAVATAYIVVEELAERLLGFRVPFA